MAGVYGQRLGKLAGVEHAPALVVQTLRAGLFAATRLTRGPRAELPATGSAPREDAYLVSIQLCPRPAFEMCVDGRSFLMPAADAGTASLVDLNRRNGADLRAGFDCLTLYLPRASLDTIAHEEGVRRVEALNMPLCQSVDDPVLRHLSASLLPALEHPERANQLFVEHVSLAAQVHIAQTYGGMEVSVPRGGLSQWQLRNAQEMLTANVDGALSLTELARSCGLSRSHFTRAFKQSMGLPPHRWLLAWRIERAKELLLNTTVPIAELTSRLGFADQSHFTRAFSRAVGITPAAWRRMRNTGACPVRA